MKTHVKLITFILLLATHSPADAVHVNPNGIGEALIVPYYTVNNQLNTLVTVTNTTASTKAIKINVREGLNGYSAKSYNVYLGAFDVWSFIMVPTESTQAETLGQPSAQLLSSDSSCAPFFNKDGEELSAEHFIDGPQITDRAREGFIEVIEMAGLDATYIIDADHGLTGRPVNCNSFESSWESGGAWAEFPQGSVNRRELPATGGLMVEASIINVMEGINHSIPVIALDNFFAEETIAHIPPNDNSLSLDAAQPTATLMDDNEVYQVAFDRGIDAVSAALMASELNHIYGIDAFVAGRTDLIFTQPTRRYYITQFGNDNSAPYNSASDLMDCEESQYGGTRIFSAIYDREAYRENFGLNCPAGIPSRDAICGSVHVQGVKYPEVNNDEGAPLITASDNADIIFTASGQYTDSGFISTEFLETRPLLGTDVSSGETIQVMGLPIIGFSLYQYTNAGAAEGLLAQYGGAQQASSKVTVIRGDEPATQQHQSNKTAMCK